MKKFLAIALLGTAISLGGCASTGGGTQTAQDILTQVQQAAIAACGFAPALNTIANIVAAGNPGVMTATAIASAICAAVSPTKMAGRRALAVRGWTVTPGRVNGVVVR